MADNSSQFQRFWRWLRTVFASQRRRNTPWSIQFIPTDISQVDAELGISKRAKEQGTAGFPAMMDAQPDFVHRLVLSHFHQKLGNLHTDVQAIARHYDEQLNQLGIERIPDQVRSAPDRFQQLADSALINFRAHLDELRDRFKNAAAAYETFKRDYGLVADADYPDSKGTYFAFPVFLLALEALFNAYVFSGADPAGRGAAGGIRIALIIALINVVIPIFIGNGLRNLNSKKLHRKALGGLCIGATLLYVPLNLFWAHYRDRAIALKNLDAFSFDELIKLRLQVLPDAWDHFMGNPLAISAIESWGLFVFGCVVVVAALTDGYLMSDPVPGYEKLHRARKQARSAFQSLHDVCLGLVEGAFQRISKELAEAAKSYGDLFARYDGLVGSQGRLETVYKNQSSDYVRSHETAVTLYRGENRLHRGREPTPEYFNRPPEALPVEPFPADFEARAKQREEVRAYAPRIAAEVATANVALQRKRAAALSEIGMNPVENPNGK